MSGLDDAVDAVTKRWSARGFFGKAATYAAGTAALALVVNMGGCITGWYDAKPYTIIPSKNFGARFTFGNMAREKLNPDIHPKWPFVSSIPVMQTNTIITEMTSVGTDKNTTDQNTFEANIRIHHVNDSEAIENPEGRGSMEVFAFQLADDDGVAFLTTLANQAVDASVAKRPVQDAMSDSENFLLTFAQNLKLRIDQNNFPKKMVAIELLTVNAGSWRRPVQIRWEPTPDGKGRIISANGEVKTVVAPAPDSPPPTPAG